VPILADASVGQPGSVSPVSPNASIVRRMIEID
jgi:hypothetical protein